MNLPLPTTPAGASAGCELVTSDGRMLSLVAAALRADARGGIARYVLEQTFENKYAERLHVTYRMPLPADGAVSGYSFAFGERVVRGVVDKKRQARERFEKAIASGHTAGLLEQERADIFTQSLGNIPPGETIRVMIEVDQRLVWLPEGEWELRFPTVIGPRYAGAADTIADVQATHVKVAEGPLPIRVSAEIAIGDAITGGRRATSPSHSLTRGETGALSLGGGARLDRDIVVRWPVAAPSAGLSLATARPRTGDDAFGLLTIVPPARDAKTTPVARDLIVLLDTSGSMGGGPLDKAKQVVSLIIDSLHERDRFELIEFNNRPSRYTQAPEHATPKAKQAALKWIRSRRADGGTEMRAGVLEAMTTLRIGAQRQIVVVTDGYVGGEQQILQALHTRLPASCRLHVLGVGSAVNRSLATALARVGRGAEVIVGVDEDAERGAKRLLDRTRLPMLTNVTIGGSALVAQAPEVMPDVFEGSPIVAGLVLSTEGGELVVRGETADGAWEQRTRVQPTRAGEGNQAIVALYARERVADLEARALLEPPDRAIEEVGLRFQIATRLTSWIAVDESRVVTGPDRTQNVPQELPYGTRAQSFGLRAPSATTGRYQQVMLEAVDAMMAFDDEAEASVRAPAYSRRAMPAAPPPPASSSVRSYSIPSQPRYPRADTDRDGAGGDFLEEEATGEYLQGELEAPDPRATYTQASAGPVRIVAALASPRPAPGGAPPAEQKPSGDVAKEMQAKPVPAPQAAAMVQSLDAPAPAQLPAERRKRLPSQAPRFFVWLLVLSVLAIIATLIYWLAG